VAQGGALECGTATDCYVDTVIATINAVAHDINFWSRIEVAALVATCVFGVIATVMIALQGDSNKYWTRPVGIVATALVTGVASLTTALHIPENIDKLIDIRRQYTSLINNFEYDLQGKTPEEADKIRKKFADDYSLLNAERLKLKGSAGRLNIGQAPAPVPPSLPPSSQAPC
jgi:hypothetical protein